MKKVLLTFMLFTLLTSMAMAQVEQGDREFQFLGSIYTAKSFSWVKIQTTYGLFITPNIQIGAGPAIDYFKFDAGGSGDDSRTTFSSSFFARYNFDVATKKIPYISAQWLQSDFAPDDPQSFTDATFLQVGGGVKFFVNEYLAYDVSGNYGFGLGESSSSALFITFGLSAFF